MRGSSASVIAMLLTVSLADATIAPAQQMANSRQALALSIEQSNGPDSLSNTSQVKPSTGSPDPALPNNPEPALSQNAAQNAPPADPPSSPQQQQNALPKPVGSAVAPYQKTTGVAASKPAGAAMAPAKQRQARSIVIRVSIVVGAAIAVGTVVALSRSSPSQPN